MNFTEEYGRRRNEINECLHASVNCFDADHTTLRETADLREAVSYALFNSGKRLRPILFLETARVLGAKITPSVIDIAVAIECVHTYSLVHDDLPCMDNDDFRRGQPTVHKKYGEALAVLTGDALLNLAYEKLFNALSVYSDHLPANLIRAGVMIANAAGMNGMVGGQACELSVGVTENNVDYVYSNKTGALISAAIVGGALAAGVDDAVINKLSEFAGYFGFCFQLADDLLDEGNDDGVQTYLSLYGKERTLARLDEYTEKAVGILSEIDGSEFLRELTLNFKNRLV